MLARPVTVQAALFNALNMTWTPTGTGKFDINDEEGWNQLPNGKVLTVDCYVQHYESNGRNYELYDPVSRDLVRCRHHAGATVGLGG